MTVILSSLLHRTPDILIVVDQQKAMDRPKWGPRNNPGAEASIARLLADRRRGCRSST